VSEVVFRGSRYPVRPGESALDALIRGGAEITFSCRKGSCQSCMVRAVTGKPPCAAQRGLRQGLVETDHFLLCLARPEEALTIEPPDLSRLFVPAMVGRIERLSDRVVRLGLETEIALAYRPGQYVRLRREDGLTRSYSTRGFTDEDYFLEVDVQLVPGGAFSTWVHEELREGQTLLVQGPLGEMRYREELRDRRLVLAGTGTGVAPLVGIAKDALRSGHAGGIELYFGARTAADLYAHEELVALAHRGLRYHAVVLEGAPPTGHRQGNLIDVVFADHPAVADTALFFAGDAALVQRLRTAAILAGARRSAITVDPFETESEALPEDDAILGEIQPDHELWEALERGPRLRRVLDRFYAKVFEDERLAPFFHNVTLERAISKQYAFLADLFSGSNAYFGLKPFNAHHWMIISDELFDYREALFDSVLREEGLPEPLIRRFLGLHERFRRSIVKSRARGLVIDGVEHLHEGYSEEILPIACLCDGCGGEMPEGSRGRMHKRTGLLYCEQCEAVPGHESFIAG